MALNVVLKLWRWLKTWDFIWLQTLSLSYIMRGPYAEEVKIEIDSLRLRREQESRFMALKVKCKADRQEEDRQTASNIWLTHVSRHLPLPFPLPPSLLIVKIHAKSGSSNLDHIPLPLSALLFFEMSKLRATLGKFCEFWLILRMSLRGWDAITP